MTQKLINRSNKLLKLPVLVKNSKNWWNGHQKIPKTAFTNTYSCYMPFCRECNSMKNCAYHFKNSDCVQNLRIKKWIYHCPDHCPDRCSDKSPDLLKRMQKCPQKRKLERERSLRCPYDVLIMSLRCPDQGDRNGRFTVNILFMYHGPNIQFKNMKKNDFFGF